MYCSHCGIEIDEEWTFCPECGNRLSESDIESVDRESADTSNVITKEISFTVGVNTVNTKNKWVAFALCLFLGFFGAHKFYEGKTGMGFLYLFTFGLCGIGWFVDIFAILLKPDPYYV